MIYTPCKNLSNNDSKFYTPNSRNCGTIFDVENKQQRITELEKLVAAPDFWQDTRRAAALSKELEHLKNTVDQIITLEKELSDVDELLQVTEDAKEQKDLEAMLEALEKEADELEFLSLFSGKYDDHDAILTIQSGAGGVDAQDWAEMLRRMYLRWCEQNGFRSTMLEESRGTEAGIKSSTIQIEGDNVYGKLRAEAGVHRLVRQSPFNADGLRQTSFARVEAMPIIEDMPEVEIQESDLRIDTYRASGAGGQHVNKTDSAVRITHIPTGLVASCQSERSQAQNKERAFMLLRAKLHQQALEKHEAEQSKLRGEHVSAQWGNQIRSYVLHPYKMVKDHRTEHETSDVESVLNGSIDAFIESYLRLRAKKSTIE